MVGKRSPGKPRITGEQISEMIRLRRRGKSISAIAQATGCHRQTVRAYLKERQADILADEVRKQVLTDELQKHLDDLTQFAVSFKSYLTLLSSPTEDRDAAAVFKPLLGEHLPQGLDSDSQKARREQRQMGRRNWMLLKSLREHTREKGWWQAFEEWQQAWDTCRKGLEEVQKQAPKVVGDLLNQKANLKEEVERKTGKKDALERMVRDVLLVAWWVGTASNPEEELEFRNFRVVPEGQRLRIITGNYYLNLIFSETETALAQEMAALCNLALRNLYQQIMVDEILGMLHRMDEKIEVIDDALDPFILRSLLVRTRCELCPV